MATREFEMYGGQPELGRVINSSRKRVHMGQTAIQAEDP